MIDPVKTSILKYGQTITLIDGNEEIVSTSKAFIQPLRSDYQSPLYEDYQEDKSIEQFLYIGLPEVDLINMPSETLIKTDDMTYTIKKVENVYLSEKVIYERAVLEKYIAEEN